MNIRQPDGSARLAEDVLAPGNKTCVAPNSTHLVLELSFSGAVYRMVVDVNDLASPNTIRFKSISHALIGGPWADGWHTGIPLDYVSDLGLHSTDFSILSTSDAVTPSGGHAPSRA